MHLSLKGDTYEQALFLADVDMDWDLDKDQLYMDLTRAGFLAFIPMPGENRFRLLGSLPVELSKQNDISIDQIKKIIDDTSGLDVNITKERWTNIYRIHHRMSERFRVERIFLVGDAAHIHSPAGGQGMNTGIGDAYNLAWKLALVVKGQAEVPLLESYEAERIPFARSILNGSDRGFKIPVTNNPVAQGLKVTLVPALFRLLSMPSGIEKRLFWLVSQLWTQYRQSPAVEQSVSAQKVQRAGGPQAGERAPYGFFESGAESGRSIFELLKGPEHHLILFEGKEPDSARLEASRVEVERVLGRYGFPVSVHQVTAGNEQLQARYGAKKPTLFLIRPDGQVAYRGEAADTVSLKLYLDRLFVERGSEPVGTKVAESSVRS